MNPFDGTPIIHNRHLPPGTAYLMNMGDVRLVVGRASRKLRLLHFLLGRTPANGFDQMVDDLR
jgi:hypothetical protein